MLAFNLGIFFRNLRGQRVRLAAENTRAQVHFVGAVSHLTERTGLSRELNVSLCQGDLELQIAFEESDDPEAEAQPEVELRMVVKSAGEPMELLKTAFAFDEIRLQPDEAAAEDEEPEPPLAG